MDAQPRCLPRLFASAAAALLGMTAAANAEPPLVAFDLPMTVECRDVTPKRYEQSYRKKIFEAVVKISPQLLAGEEKDLKKLHYRISTEQQMPVISYAPSSQVTSDIAGAGIAIQTDDHHGQLLVHYMVTPAVGDGKLTGDLNSSHAQYTLLAPKQILVAAGTIERGCGVYYELKPSTQDTLQKQREFACLFEVPAGWRADHITVQCYAKGVKRALFGESEADCGQGTLSVGLYRQDDGEAKQMANDLARRQQAVLDQAAAQSRAKKPKGGKTDWIPDLFAEKPKKAIMKEASAQAGVLAELEAQGYATDKGMKNVMSDEPQDPGAELSSAKDAIRRMNGRL